MKHQFQPPKDQTDRTQTPSVPTQPLEQGKVPSKLIIPDIFCPSQNGSNDDYQRRHSETVAVKSRNSTQGEIDKHFYGCFKIFT